MKPVAKGQPILPALTSEWYNHTIKPRIVPKPPPRKKGRKPGHEDLAVFIPSETYPTVARFEAVGVESPTDTYSSAATRVDRNTFVSKEALNQYNWVVAQLPMSETSKSQPVVYFGVTYAKVNVIDESHKFVKLNEDTLELETANYGKGMLLYAGASYSLICLGPYIETGYVGITTTAISGRSGMQLGSGYFQLLTVDSTGLMSVTCEIRQGFNTQLEEIVSGQLVQAKNWLGLPLLDVIPCEEDSESYDLDCPSGSDSGSF